MKIFENVKGWLVFIILAVISVLGFTVSRSSNGSKLYKKTLEEDVDLINKQIKDIQEKKSKLVEDKVVTKKQVEKLDNNIKELEQQRFDIAKKIINIESDHYTEKDIEQVLKKLKNL